MVEVGEVNNLSAAAIIIAEPTCGEANGNVTIDVTGGSGNFTFDWGPANRTDLPGGLYTVNVTDNESGCTTSVQFALSENVNGAVVNAQNVTISCNGMTGAADFNVSPSAGFVGTPRTEVQDMTGNVVDGNNLVIGSYCVLVFDGNDCLAGQDCFEVNGPAAIMAQATPIAQDCNQLGSIQLNLSLIHI